MPNYRRYNSHSRCYFFTLVSYQRSPLFIQPAFRELLHNSIKRVQQAYAFKIDAMVLLPDHLHCIWTLPEEDDNYSRRWSMIKRFVSQGRVNGAHGAPYDGAAFNIVNDADSTAFDVGCAMRTKSRIKRGESNIWQRRFWEHEIRDQRDYEKHLDYCYWNPLKHGLVNRVCDWPYSTFHRDVKKGLYPPDWCGDTVVFEKMSFGE